MLYTSQVGITRILARLARQGAVIEYHDAHGQVRPGQLERIADEYLFHSCDGQEPDLFCWQAVASVEENADTTIVWRRPFVAACTYENRLRPEDRLRSSWNFQPVLRRGDVATKHGYR